MSRTNLSAEALERSFAELHPPLEGDAALAAASRCLFCHDAPCTRACPTHIDVPRFIRQILHANLAGAAETILEENILGGSCARICPTEVLCEGACVDRALHGMPIPIGRLQRVATDHADARGIRFFEAGPGGGGRRVAVVGAGPAGLACAHEVRRRGGHAVTVFEERDLPGGLGTLAIAPYKIRPEYVLEEVERVRAIGVEVRLGERIDAARIAALLADHDAVFLGIGLGATASLGIPGEDAPGVWEGLAFIFQAHRMPFAECEVGREVVVLGGGNTAIDAAVLAARLGAERVTLAYRRTRETMPAYTHEVELARADGVAFEWLATPVEFIREAATLRAVRFVRVRMEGEGRGAGLVRIPGSEFEVRCDMAVKALGQEPLRPFLEAVPGLAVTKDGRIETDPATGATSVPRLFAGGDCASGGAEVVHAVQQGKLAARAICEMRGRRS